MRYKFDPEEFCINQNSLSPDDPLIVRDSAFQANVTMTTNHRMESIASENAVH